MEQQEELSDGNNPPKDESMTSEQLSSASSSPPQPASPSQDSMSPPSPPMPASPPMLLDEVLDDQIEQKRLMRHHSQLQQQLPAQECPRCESVSTKFCYFNNYSVSQPRYFCRNCRRYWTQGGTLRNVPVGGGCRKAKRQRRMEQALVLGPPMPMNHQVLIRAPQNISFGTSQITQNISDDHNNSALMISSSTAGNVINSVLRGRDSGTNMVGPYYPGGNPTHPPAGAVNPVNAVGNGPVPYFGLVQRSYNTEDTPFLGHEVQNHQPTQNYQNNLIITTAYPTDQNNQIINNRPQATFYNNWQPGFITVTGANNPTDQNAARPVWTTMRVNGHNDNVNVNQAGPSSSASNPNQWVDMPAGYDKRTP